MTDPAGVRAIAEEIEIDLPQLDQEEIGLLVDFLHSLTDRRSIDLRRDVPPRVPSGLPVFD